MLSREKPYHERSCDEGSTGVRTHSFRVKWVLMVVSTFLLEVFVVLEEGLSLSLVSNKKTPKPVDFKLPVYDNVFLKCVLRRRTRDDNGRSLILLNLRRLFLVLRYSSLIVFLFLLPLVARLLQGFLLSLCANSGLTILGLSLFRLLLLAVQDVSIQPLSIVAELVPQQQQHVTLDLGLLEVCERLNRSPE